MYICDAAADKPQRQDLHKLLKKQKKKVPKDPLQGSSDSWGCAPTAVTSEWPLRFWSSASRQKEETKLLGAFKGPRTLRC